MTKHINDRWILSHRPPKNIVDPWQPYAFLTEPEYISNGIVENVATIFLTNKECPFRCLMCDLWKNTTDETVPLGAIPAQIKWALAKLPDSQHIKLYNSGNFFDIRAIPPSDLSMIASMVSHFKTVIIECHPKLLGKNALEFQKMLQPKLQIAMGLETVHPKILPKLNKRMTLDDFKRATDFLNHNDISIRTFILVKPPFLNEEEGIDWAKLSVDFAFDAGMECCAVIPTRAGNGAMEQLQTDGFFSPPEIKSLEAVLEYGISLQRGRVFADLWDIEKFSNCKHCVKKRIKRMNRMNLTQQVLPRVDCVECM